MTGQGHRQKHVPPCGLHRSPVLQGKTKYLLGKSRNSALVSELDISTDDAGEIQVAATIWLGWPWFANTAMAHLGQYGRVLTSCGDMEGDGHTRVLSSVPPKDDLKQQRLESNKTLCLTTGSQCVFSFPQSPTCCELMLGSAMRLVLANKQNSC